MHRHGCPIPDELSAYLLGKLSHERFEVLDSHLDGCTSCQAALRELGNTSDSLVPQLRGTPIPAAADAVLDGLLSRAKSLGPPRRSAALVAEQARQRALASGQLGQYRLLEKIGQGGMGAVYKALHLRLDKVVALKVLPPEQMNTPDDVARFEREMRAVGKLNHPNIVRATDAGEADGVHFLVMEFVEGEDLAKLVKRLGRLPVAVACELMRQAAIGLQHAHEHGLVHRDIKPSNLLLSKDGEVKVLDLGLARFQSEQAGRDLTPHGQGMGTLDYMAPEQASDARRVDIRADLYSLGCTLYHLLTSRPPFGGPEYPNAAQKLTAHQRVVPPPLRGLRSDVPDTLDTLVNRLLAKERTNRPATPREVAETLAPLAADCDVRRSLDLHVRPTELPDKVAPDHETWPPEMLHAPTTPPGGQLVPPPRQPRVPTIPLLVGAIVVVVLLAALPLLLRRDGKGLKHAVEPDPMTEAPIADRPDPPTPPTVVADTRLAEQGTELLKHYCYRCHGIDFKVPRFNVLDRTVLLAPRGKDEQPYVVPGKPEESAVWQHVGIDGDMPPGGKKPSEEEKLVLKQWITAGAPFPDRAPRAFKSAKETLTSVRDHLQRTPAEARPFQRYFNLAHLHNNHQHVSADDLRLHRAALAKVVNSLSWKPVLAKLQPIDAEECLLCIDLRDVGWDEADLWKAILEVNPYGLTHEGNADETMRQLAGAVATFAGTEVPVLRADWFVATATRPPLYHKLLRLPMDARALERQLQVDVRQNILRHKVARAGLVTSGVSRQNRVVERHDAVHGAYWKSYDFKHNDGTGNLLKLPLGPVFEDNPYPKSAFEHDGGEIIFHLPNGLQGYVLVDGKDNRIDAGPIEVVRDAQETAGTPVIVNGLSCMACHKLGMVRFEDRVRDGSAVAGEALVEVQRLYRKKEEMDRLLDQDEQRFVRSLEEVAGPFLKTGADRDRNIRDFPEPVGAVARLYVRDLGLEEVSLELGMADSNKLKTLIEGNSTLRRLGLGPLANGGRIKRDVWSSLEFTTSLFHNVAKELGLGTPHVSF